MLVHKGDGVNSNIRTPRGLQGTGCRPMAAKGIQTDVVHVCRISHAGRGSETSGQGCQVAGVGKVQVYIIPLRERSWGVGVTDRERGGTTMYDTDWGSVEGKR